MVGQYEVYWVNLDPTIGSEINKIRPCVVISPNVSNKLLNTVARCSAYLCAEGFTDEIAGKIGQ